MFNGLEVLLYALGVLKQVSFTHFIGCCLDELLHAGFFVDANFDLHQMHEMSKEEAGGQCSPRQQHRLLIAFDRVPHLMR